jgi:metal-responsive CopG/Arc/MetJ family transcriptional regulator
MMIRTQVYLPEELHRELKLLAHTERVNYSELIRDGVREVVNKKARRQTAKGWEAFIGACKTKVKTNAVKDIHDYYLLHAI